MGRKKASSAAVKASAATTVRTRIAGIVEELDNTPKLLEARKAASGDPAGDESLGDRLTRSVAAKINKLETMEPSDAEALLTSVARSGHSKANRDSLVATIDAKLDSCLDNDPVISSGSMGQLLTKPQYWLKRSHVNFLFSTKNTFFFSKKKNKL